MDEWVQSTSFRDPNLPEYYLEASESQPQQPAHNSLSVLQSLNPRQPWLLRHGSLLKGRKSLTGEGEEQHENSFSPLSDSMNGLSHPDHPEAPRGSHAVGEVHAGNYSPPVHHIQMRQPDLQAETDFSQQPALSFFPEQDQRHMNQDRGIVSMQHAQAVAVDPWQSVHQEQRVSTSCQGTMLICDRLSSSFIIDKGEAEAAWGSCEIIIRCVRRALVKIMDFCERLTTCS